MLLRGLDLAKASDEEMEYIDSLICSALAKDWIETLNPEKLHDLFSLIKISNDPKILPTIREMARNKYAL